MDLLIAIPVKPFGVAKARLKPVLNADQRSRLGRSTAAATIHLACKTGARVAVVTGDAGVADWAVRQGVDVVSEPEPGGLDRAAAAAVKVAQSHGGGWAILHADLPLLEFDELESALGEWEPGKVVLCPSYDGGTSLLVGEGDFPFAYGPGSFHRHLSVTPTKTRVVVRRGLALDLDTPRDLITALRIKPWLDMAWTARRL